MILALLGCTKETTPPSVATPPVVVDPERMLERQAIYQAWKRDMDQLANDSGEPILTQVKAYMDQGVAFAAPQASGDIVVRVADGNPVFSVLVLLPEDTKLSPNWAERYNNRHLHGAASFHTDGNYMVIRADNTSPKVRAMLLGHEGVHALAAQDRSFAKQNDEEYCGEEAVAHRMEIEIMKKVMPSFTAYTKREAKKVTTSLRANRGQTFSAQFDLHETTFTQNFGQPTSDTEIGYRATMLTLGAVYYGALQFYQGDDEVAMDRLAHYLCGLYKEHGIR